jgi:phage shock protein PspC (stress-responsive transcriptional regulator)
VCAGIADYFAVDVVIVRIAAVVLAVSGPGVLAYGLAWILIPEARDDDPFSAQSDSARRDRGAQIFGIVLLAVAVSILWGSWWSPARRWMFPLGLIVLGGWLVLRRTEPAGPASEVTATDRAPPPGPGGPPPQRQPRPPAEPHVDARRRPVLTEEQLVARRRRRMVFPSVLGALFVWAGVAFLAGVAVQTGLAVALCIVGLGFVLGAFVGGSKALIVPALVLAFALVATSALDLPLDGPVGERTWVPRTMDELDASYELSMGDGTLDLTELVTGRQREVPIRATVGIGHLLVVLPDDAALVVRADASAGDITIFGRSDSGVGVSTDRRFGPDDAAVTYRLDLEVGLGQVEVLLGPTDRRDAASSSTTATLG